MSDRESYDERQWRLRREAMDPETLAKVEAADALLNPPPGVQPHSVPDDAVVDVPTGARLAEWLAGEAGRAPKGYEDIPKYPTMREQMERDRKAARNRPKDAAGGYQVLTAYDDELLID